MSLEKLKPSGSDFVLKSSLWVREIIGSAYLHFLYKASITANISGKIMKNTKHRKSVRFRGFAKA